MLRVPIEQAKAGMSLSLPVIHPGNMTRVLLQAGAKLTVRSIERLDEQRVREIWIDWPGLEFISEQVNPQLEQSHREFTYKLGTIFDTVADDTHAEVDYSHLKFSVTGFMDKLLESPRAAFYLSEMMGDKSPELRHASAVCLTSLLIGLKLGGYLVQQRKKLKPKDAANIVNLGVGAMLHDIGMMRLDSVVTDRFYNTGDESDEEWREHVRLGYHMVSGKVDPSAAAAVLHHHQRFDGLGFPPVSHAELRYEPDGQIGDKIHIFSRIIAAADLYDRLRFCGQDTRVRTRVRTLKMLRDPQYSCRLDPVVLEGLFSVTPPYPPGALVTLSTGEKAVVIGWTHKDPCRPTVRIIGELNDDPPDEDVVTTVDLRTTAHTEIAFAEGETVINDNFYYGSLAA